MQRACLFVEQLPFSILFLFADDSHSLGMFAAVIGVMCVAAQLWVGVSVVQMLTFATALVQRMLCIFTE